MTLKITSFDSNFVDIILCPLEKANMPEKVKLYLHKT